ncbi:MAG: GntR family transcriptional regulator [Phycisphaeraceae bacterium]|nr:GntR family transcriptional regulator [Phycisphaeraceae bacterium]
MPLAVPDQSSELLGTDRAEVLFQQLRAAIETGSLTAGQKIAPLRELAMRYGVSPATARTAVARLEGLNLVRRRHGSGTYVQSGVTGVESCAPAGQANVAAMLLPSRDHLFDNMSTFLTQHFQSNGILPLTLHYNGKLDGSGLRQVFDQWRKMPPRVVVLQYDYPELDHAVLEACGGRSRIILAYRSRIPGFRCHLVNPDFPATTVLAAKALVRHGHQRIGFVTGDLREPKIKLDPTFHPMRDKLVSAGQYLRATGLARAFSFRRCPSFWPQEAIVRSLAAWLQGPHRPTAVVGDDNRLINVIRAAGRVGLSIPRDLTLVGLGDTPWAHTFGFPSVSHSIEQIAQRVVRLALDAEPDATLPLHILTVPPTFDQEELLDSPRMDVNLTEHLGSRISLIASSQKETPL